MTRGKRGRSLNEIIRAGQPHPADRKTTTADSGERGQKDLILCRALAKQKKKKNHVFCGAKGKRKKHRKNEGLRKEDGGE